MNFEVFFVFVVSIIAALAGIGVVMMRTTVYSALCLVLNFFCLAALYLTLNAEFVAVVNVIVYAGAIMVLFLFVIFLINPTREESQDRLTDQRAWGLFLGVGLLVLLGAIVGLGGGLGVLNQSPPALPAITADSPTNIALVGELLYTRFLFPFELTSLILLAAIIGAIILAKRTI